MVKNVNGKQHNSALKAGLGYTVGNILVNGIAFLSIPIFTRLLSTADYGIYSSFVTYQGILSMIIGLTLHLSLKNAKYDFPEERDAYNSSLLLLILLIAVGGLLLGGLFQERFGQWLSIDSSFLVPLVVYSFSTALLFFFNAYLVLDYSYKPYLVVSLFFSVSSILLSVLLVLTCFSDQRAYGRVIGSVIPITLVACYILWFFFKRKKPNFNKTYWKYGLAISLPLVPHVLSQLILTQFDRVMILKIIGASAAGIYSLAYTLAMVLQIIFTSLDSIWTTWFFERMTRKEYGEIKNKSRYYVVFMSLLTVMFFLVSPEVIKVFAGKAYWDAQYVVIPVALALYFSFLYYIPAGVEYYHKKTIYIAVGTMLAAAVNVILNLLLIPRYGYVIAAYTTLFSYILYFVLHLFIVWQLEKRFVFDIKAMMFSLVGTSFFAFLAMLCLKAPVIRWVLFFLLLVLILRGLYRRKDVVRSLLKKESGGEVT